MYAEIMILQPERACGKDSVPFICVQRVDFLHRKLLWMAKLFIVYFTTPPFGFCTSPYWLRSWLPIRRKRDKRLKYWFFP